MENYPIFGLVQLENGLADPEHIEDLRKGQFDSGYPVGTVACVACGAEKPQYDGFYALPTLDMSALVCSIACAGEIAWGGQPQGWCTAVEVWMER